MNKFVSVASRAAAAVAAVLAAQPVPAAPVALGNVITNGGFAGELSNGWTSQGIANVRRADNAINSNAARDGGGNATFDGFFNSRFAVLGDSSGMISPTDPVVDAQGMHTLSQSFTLASLLTHGHAIDYRLNIYLRTVFDGRDSTGNRPGDRFSAHLVGPSGSFQLFSQTSQGLGTCGPSVYPNCADAQKVIDRGTSRPLALESLLPGAYTLTFALHEALGGGPNDTRHTQTAAGIDDVRVMAFARVPEPTSLALAMAGLLGLWLSMRARRS